MLKSQISAQTWSKHLQDKAVELEVKMARFESGKLRQALSDHMNEEWQQLCEGAIVGCKAQKQHYEDGSGHVVWQEGSAKLIDYCPESSGYPILVIPSLINRAYILDLHPNCSYLKFLVEKGYRPFLMEWNDPLQQEAHFKPEDYVKNYLLKAVERVVETTGMPVFVLGYCMGGVLGLGLAMLVPEKIQGLILCATPWNFHVKEQTRIDLKKEDLSRLRNILQKHQTIPAEIVQVLFYWLYPDMVRQKLKRLAYLGGNADGISLAMERWVNDGIGLTRGCAEAFWLSWMQENQLYQNRWYIGDIAVNPAQLRANLPVLCVVPTKDRIVPSTSSLAISNALQQRSSGEASIKSITPNTGHVGMMVGRLAREEFWDPSHEWMAAILAS